MRHWTTEQQKAIDARDNNILVAAAAGSGKTAVLVERIIRRIADEAHPLDVDKLLVVTFTKAAASEMKGRIRTELEKELKNNPKSAHLRRQLLLLTRAQISTLHAFCMDVVKRHTYMLDLDPAFRVADDIEARLLRQDVLDALFEEEYGAGAVGTSDFYTLVDWYSNDRSDAQLQALVLQLHSFAQSQPWPEQWLDEAAAMYDVHAGATVDRFLWIEEMKASLSLDLQSAVALLRQAIAVASQPNGPHPYIEALEDDLQQYGLAIVAQQTSWQALQQVMSDIEFGRLKAVKKEEYDVQLIEQVQQLREQVKKRHTELVEKYFMQDPDEIMEMLSQMHPIMRALIELVKKFGERYQVAKLEKGLVDFADLEHYSLQILRDSSASPHALLPSEIAKQYRSHFAEILVDEYQDTNKVQESILTLLAKDDATGGNRFIVGDVKQSIYRFRLTEPQLFLEKYEAYHPDGVGTGLRIDLSKNFRSRTEVLQGTNVVFRQIMRRDVAEIDYDDDAELKVGATYPQAEDPHTHAVELHILDRDLAEDEDDDAPISDIARQGAETGNDVMSATVDASTTGEYDADDIDDLENAEIEARWIATRIRTMITGEGTSDGSPYLVYDRTSDRMRSITYRDIVILLRATHTAAPLMLEELQKQGIPAYAEVAGGYFAATEIEIMLSLLRIVDNPQQDIPLAAVLRSPIVQLTAEEMGQLRLARQDGNYYEALLAYIDAPITSVDAALQERIQRFHAQLVRWRTDARHGALADLIWRMYQDTGYYDFVGSLPGGKERQANLRALYDRARQFEQSAFRGLHRFLRFVERMQERGEEMGTARALGEQEDVVRIMTIHKSKGLEFPVVFIAGLAKQFNMRDLYGGFLYHKDLGLGSKWVDTEHRITYPTLPQLAIRTRKLFELLAEEQRMLYVAMTRAKEKLILVGTVRKLEKRVQKWSAALAETEWQLPAHLVASSRTYLDWLGIALMRHQAAAPLLDILFDEGYAPSPSVVRQEESLWVIHITKAAHIPKSDKAGTEQATTILHAIQAGHPISAAMHSPLANAPTEAELSRRLLWQDISIPAQHTPAKVSVSEIKRRWQLFEGQEQVDVRTSITKRPRFMERQGLTATERGSAMHMMMQQIALDVAPTEATLRAQLDSLITRELLTVEQAAVIDFNSILTFFAHPLGERVLRAKRVLRELPFSYVLLAKDVYKEEWKDAGAAPTEHVLIQGIIDALIEEEDGWLLLDYKTDRTTGVDEDVLRKRYEVQMDLYAQAVEAIWKRPLKAKIVYFFDGAKVMEL